MGFKNSKLTIEQLFSFINDECMLNMAKVTRKREYTEARSLFAHILHKHYNLRDEMIVGEFYNLGLKTNRATVYHSRRKAEMYMGNNPTIKKVYYTLYPLERKAKEVFIEEKTGFIKDSLYNLVKDIPLDRRAEVEDRIKILIDSWSWKTGIKEKNKRTLAYEIYT